MTNSIFHLKPEIRKLPIMMWAIFLVSIQIATAQTMFQRHYGGIGDDYGCRVLQTNDGGYLVAAITESFGAGYRDIYLIKTNELGDTLWTKTIGGPGGEQPNSVKVTNDSNFIIVGSTSSYGAGSYDIFLLKVDQNGDTIWTKTFGGPFDEDGSDVIQTSDDGYLIIGATRSFTSGTSSMYAIKTDNLGDTLWTKTFEEKASNMGASVLELSNGNYLFVGQTLFPGQMNTADCFLVMANAAGDTLCTKTFGGSDYDGAFMAQETSLGDIAISGTSKSIGSGGYDIFLSLYSIDGDELWIKAYGGTLDDYGGVFSFTNDGGYIITGYTENYGAGNQDMYLIKTNIFGDTLWTKTFGNANNESALSVVQTLDHGYIMSGYSNSFGGGYQVFLVKTNSEGVSGFQKIIRQDVKCKVFPNPSNGNFYIEFDNPENQKVFIRVFDNSGRLIFEKDEGINEINAYSVSLIGFPSGIYTINIHSCNNLITKRIIIQN